MTEVTMPVCGFVKSHLVICKKPVSGTRQPCTSEVTMNKMHSLVARLINRIINTIFVIMEEDEKNIRVRCKLLVSHARLHVEAKTQVFYTVWPARLVSYALETKPYNVLATSLPTSKNI